MQSHVARGVCVVLVAVVLLASLSGCASLFRSERVGRSPSQVSSKIDWGWLVIHILNLNLFGLLTDFITGAIYYGTHEAPR